MKDDVAVMNGVIIPGAELELSASRAGGPGGQHVNKASTRITVRWNILKTAALTDEQKERVFHNLKAELTADGDLIVHSSASRSQQQNKKDAIDRLAYKIRKALYVPKKRMKSTLPRQAKEARLQTKKKRALIKTMRGKKSFGEW